MRVVDDLIDAACDGGAGDNVAVVALRGTVDARDGGWRLSGSDEAEARRQGSAVDEAEARRQESAVEDADRLRSTHPVDLDPADRFRGCLLGGAIGDALGAGVEHDSLRRIRRRFGPDGLADPAPAYGRASAITDDTQMTLFTAEALLRTFTRAAERGVPGDAVWQLDQAYARWLRTQGERSLRWPNPGDPSTVERLLAGSDARRGPGRTCIAAMRGSVAGTPDDPTNSSKGCGGVMRVAPIGLMVEDLGEAMILGARSAALTHGHPTGQAAAAALAGLIALLGTGAPLSTAVAVVAGELGFGDRVDETIEALMRARSLLGQDVAPSPEVIQSLGEGWVADEALAIGVGCALLARDFEHGLLLAVNHGGDSDSTGAIAGALLGMMFGADAIPTRWLDGLEHATEIAAIADDLHAAASEDGDPDVLGERWQARWPAE
jgi:ADP-ribosylglycohydrolase